VEAGRRGDDQTVGAKGINVKIIQFDFDFDNAGERGL
jgi:hypothetical protein